VGVNPLFRNAVLTWIGAASLSGALAADALQEARAGAPGAPTLHGLFARERLYQLQLDPMRTSLSGDRRWNRAWPDLSPDAFEARKAHVRSVLAELDAIDQKSLSSADRLNSEIFRESRERERDELELRWHLLPVRHNVGIHVIDQQAGQLRFQTMADYEDWIERLRAFPAYMDQTIALMREGIRARMVFPKEAMARVPPMVQRHLVTDPAQSGFFKPFLRYPAEVAPADRARLDAAAKETIASGVVPAYRRFLEFFTRDYLPAAPTAVGVWTMPGGERLYRHFIRRNTTLDLTPGEIHERGLAEVARIRREMEAAIARTGFKGTFAEFTAFLRADPRFYFKTSDELLTSYRALAKRIDPLLVKVIRTLPRMPYGVEPVPAAVAADTVAGSYGRGTADGTRAGTLFVNVSMPETRPKYEMLTLALHEGVPGHHIQRALSMELRDVPDFRRDERSPVFSEGWALYAESLGRDMGLFDDPYSEFGALSGEMWRAVRLVVDTGIHWGRWDRERALLYFRDNTARPESDIVQEIDRYSEIPGQALAYKTGEMKIKELRARAQAALGPRFDLREFHDVVLELGTVPLGPLERHVDEWIAARRAQTPE
jgi:uncharacterized protein (DUF885 family)